MLANQVSVNTYHLAKGCKVDVNDLVKVKLGRREQRVNTFSAPVEVREVHKWHVVLVNGQKWNKRRVALYCKKGDIRVNGKEGVSTRVGVDQKGVAKDFNLNLFPSGVSRSERPLRSHSILSRFNDFIVG